MATQLPSRRTTGAVIDPTSSSASECALSLQIEPSIAEVCTRADHMVQITKRGLTPIRDIIGSTTETDRERDVAHASPIDRHS
jgi:hypothetical protein